MKTLSILLIGLLLAFPLACTDTSATSASDPIDVLPTRATDPQAEMVKFTSGIRVVYQDSKGHYWLGSDHEGVCRFDGKAYTYFDMAEVGCLNQVVTMQEDQFGTMWFGTNKGVCCYREGVLQALRPDVTVSPGNGQGALAPSDLWLIAGGTDIYRVVEGRAHLLPSQFHQRGGLEFDGVVTDLAKGKGGRLWIASYGGVAGFDGAAWTMINDSTLGLNEDSVKLHIRGILEDSRERLWIGNNGIGVLLRQGDTIFNFSAQMGLVQHTPVGKPSPSGTLMHVFAIGEDAQGHIWFGDRDTGAWEYDGHTIQNHDIDPALSSKMIWDIYQDHHGNLLFGMADGGVYRFDGKGFARVL